MNITTYKQLPEIGSNYLTDLKEVNLHGVNPKQLKSSTQIITRFMDGSVTKCRTLAGKDKDGRSIEINFFYDE